jgi:heavy metal sensor kinase
MSRARTLARTAWAHLRTIRVRLTLWYVALLAAILLAFGAFLYVSLARTLHDEIDRALSDEARRTLETLDIQNGVVHLGETPEGLVSGTLVVLADTSGQLVSANAPAASVLPLAASARATRDGPQLTTVSLQGDEWRVLSQPVIVGGQTAAVLQVARSEQGVEVALDRLLLLMGLAVPLTLLLAVAGGLFLANRALVPIDRITRTAARIGAGDLSRRLALPASPDEVGRLSATFDAMLDRLEEAFARQRRFTADASHELRTPLALLTGRAEVALDRPRTPAEYQAALAGIRDDAVRMAQLLGELLTLARADREQEALAREPVPLADLVADTLAALEPLAEERGVALEAGALIPCTIVGDQTRLTQLLINLVDNALTYTPAGGRVTVGLARDADMALLSVADTGIGIAPEHLEHLFERFYRVDAARSRAAGGAGLGLAIADWIARAHDGEVAVTSRIGVGSIFSVRLPLAPPERATTGADALRTDGNARR